MGKNDMQRRTLLHMLATSTAMSIIPPAYAQQNFALFEPKRGQDYDDITPPQPGGIDGIIEVIAFFSYMCPHCYDFEHLLTPWVAKLPAQMRFQRSPVHFGIPEWAASARLYLVLREMGLASQLHSRVFDAIHGQRLNVSINDARSDWVMKQGIDLAKFNAYWNSFGIEAQSKRAELMARDFKVQSVPAMAVNGRYRVIASSNTFATVEALSEKLRSN